MWVQHVTQEMTYGEGSQLCLGCLSCFYDEKKSTHPKQSIVKLADYVVKEQLTNMDEFHDHFWKLACKLQIQFGRILLPQYSLLHAQPLHNFKGAEGFDQLNQALAKIVTLEEELRQRDLAEGKLKKGLDEVHMRVAVLMERSIKEKGYHERVKLTATQHLEALWDMLHPEGCGCTNGCRSLRGQSP